MASTIPATAAAAAGRLLDQLGRDACEVLADADQLLRLAEDRAGRLPDPPALARGVAAAWQLIAERSSANSSWSSKPARPRPRSTGSAVNSTS